MMTLSPSLTVLICPLPSSAVEYWSSLFLVRNQQCLGFFAQADIKEYSRMNEKHLQLHTYSGSLGSLYKTDWWLVWWNCLPNNFFLCCRSWNVRLVFLLNLPAHLLGFHCKFISVNVLFVHFTNWGASYILITTTGHRYRHNNTVLISANHAQS